MKWIGISLVCFLAVGGMAQNEEIIQSGTPAVIEAVNGKKARVFLQGMEGDRLTFQAYQSTRNITVPTEAVKSLEFFPQYDADALREQFNAGDYAGMLDVLVPLLEPYVDYMPVNNNLRDLYSLLMEVYFKTGDYVKAQEAARIMTAFDDPLLVERGQVHLALIAIALEDLETAKQIHSEITDEAAGLYLKACIQRAENRTVEAFKTVADVLLFHSNDFEWLGRSELLSAYLYMDYMETNSVVGPESALFTARQAMNIYRGSSVSADAAKLWEDLGGAELEAEIQAQKEKEEAEEAERRAQRAEEREQREAAEAKKKDAAADETGTNMTDSVVAETVTATNVDTNVKRESE